MCPRQQWWYSDSADYLRSLLWIPGVDPYNGQLWNTSFMDTPKQTSFLPPHLSLSHHHTCLEQDMIAHEVITGMGREGRRIHIPTHSWVVKGIVWECVCVWLNELGSSTADWMTCSPGFIQLHNAQFCTLETLKFKCSFLIPGLAQRHTTKTFMFRNTPMMLLFICPHPSPEPK